MTAQNHPRRTVFNPGRIVLLLLPLLGVAAAALVIATSGVLPGSTPPTSAPATPPPSPLIGRSAPNFELPALEGGTIRLSSLRGRVVFLNFWATWCEPCKRELPAFEAFMAYQNPDSGAVILALNMGEAPKKILPFLAENRVANLSVLLDTDYRVEAAYRVNAYPTTVVIDPAGLVHDVHLGELKLADLNAYVAQLVSQ